MTESASHVTDRLLNNEDNVIVQANRYCRRLAKTSYENFSIASFLIPADLRQDFYNIYAYCRYSDDLADEQNSPAAALAGLDAWQKQLEIVLSNQQNPVELAKNRTSPILIALSNTIGQRKLASGPFFDLLQAFRQDQSKIRYESHEELIEYCALSANPVGRILLNLARVSDTECYRRSDAICTGLQLANFCQDMKRDAAMNRIYMPRELWRAHSISEEMVLAGTSHPSLQKALADWVRYARDHFVRGWELHKHVPNWLARDVQLFAGGGLAVCDAIASQHFDVWTRRPKISKATKLRLLVRSLWSSKFPHSQYFSQYVATSK